MFLYVCAGTQGSLYAIPCNTGVVCSDNSQTENFGTTSTTCLDNPSTYRCYTNSNGIENIYKIPDCAQCRSGFTLTDTVLTSPAHGCTITAKLCTRDGGDPDPGDDCDGTCDNCESTDWTTAATGYQTRTIATCNKTTCVCSKSVSYRCASRYYKSGPVISCVVQVGGSRSCAGCSRCPSPGRSSAGSSSITSCCVSPSTNMSDNTGTYHFNETCCYTE